MTQKKLYIKTFGCQMNTYDSDRITELLAIHGYSITDSPSGASLSLLNTCHIREKATEKVFSDLGRLKPYKETASGSSTPMVIAVAGCTAQAEGTEIMRRAPYVDIVLGPQAYHKLPQLLEEISRKDPKKRTHLSETSFPVESKFDHLPLERHVSGSGTAYLSIQEGCDKFCTFCCVPYTRGAEYSRPVRALVDETRRLLDQGAQEITLLGQNVNAYHGEGLDGKEWGLGRLLFALADTFPQLKRLRYTTSHPHDVDDELIQAHKEIPLVMPLLHLPVQSGSDKVLTEMNRKHTRAHYLELINKFKKARPDMSFSSDFIVGFPGESDKDFAQTLSLVNEVGFSQAYTFSYSPRPGTPASILSDQLPEDTKKKRLHLLQELITTHQQAFNESFVGKTVDVLFERHGKLPFQFLGKTPHGQPVVVHSKLPLIGTTALVKITSALPRSLEGSLMEQWENRAHG